MGQAGRKQRQLNKHVVLFLWGFYLLIMLVYKDWTDIVKRIPSGEFCTNSDTSLVMVPF